jgi:PAS domain S-box-containing protein
MGDSRIAIEEQMSELREGASPSALEALRKSEERYRRLLASVTDYVYTVTVVDGQPVSTSHGPGCVAVTGYAAEEYAADPFLWHRMVHEDDQAAVTEQARRVLNGEGAPPLEHRIRHRNSSIRWVRNTPVPRLDEAGNVVAYDGLISDITARKLAEQALRESEEKYRKLVEGSTDAIFLEALPGQILECNSAACAIFGYSKEEMLALEVKDLVPEEVHSSLAGVVEEVRTTGSLFARAVNVRKGGEAFPCEVSTRLITVGDEPRVIAFVRDISDRERFEAEIRSLATQLRKRNEELEASNLELESFCYSVSHDLRTPLLMVDGFSKLLIEDHMAALEPEAARLLRLVRLNVERMEHLIDDLLAFSRCSFQPMARRPVDLAALAREVLRELSFPEQGRHLELRVAELPPALGDPSLLKQVLVNLIGNALKFTRTRELAVIEMGAAATQQGPVYFVRDNGIGFDPRHARELFGVFKRFHRSDLYEGSGVGLAIALRIVQRHGGQIWAEAEVDRGATFYFTLPPCGPEC